MPFTSKNPLNISSINGGIAVLSFQNRTILDLISLSDNSTLVDVALQEIESKYDIILMDICNEPSAVANACLLKSNQIYQVWGNAPPELKSISSAVTNNLICSCPLDKMKNIIISNTVDDVKTDYENLMSAYHFKELAHVGKSLDIARLICRGIAPYDYVTDSEDIEEFNDCINNICAKILGVTIEKKDSFGSFTANDVSEGKVEGTVTKKQKDRAKKKKEVVKEDTEKALKEMQNEISIDLFEESKEDDE
jgi:hypothetical protein